MSRCLPTTKSQEQRMRNAIKELLLHTYPSAAKISRQMGRNTPTINGREAVTRRMLFKELGIQIKGSSGRITIGNSPLDEE